MFEALAMLNSWLRSSNSAFSIRNSRMTRSASSPGITAPTCGVSGAVVCCEVKATGGKRGACRIRPAAKCTSSPKIARHDCSPVTGCADTQCATQSTCAE